MTDSDDKWLLKNGVVIDPASGFFDRADVLFSIGKPPKGAGTILAVGTDLPTTDAIVLDCTDLYITPGFIDLHTHLREPGETHKETIETGCQAAVAGGFTTICCMPNTRPPLDSPESVAFVRQRAETIGLCEVLPIGAVSLSLEHQRLTEMVALKEAGAIAFSDDGYPIQDASFLRKVLEYSRACDGLVILHPEDKSLTAGGQAHEGLIALIMGLRGMPREAEYLPVHRAITLAEVAGARIHIAHISVKETVAALRQGKEMGVAVSGEVTPHHLALTDENLVGYRTEFKMNPPLREQTDRDAVIEGLRDGTIDCIATDHAPHSVEEKETTFDEAPFGVIGLETALPIVWTELVHKRNFPVLRLVDALTWSPAKVLRIKRGRLEPGWLANITIFDPSKRWQIRKEQFKSRSRNTPFDGWEVQGAVLLTFYQGRLVYHSPEVSCHLDRVPFLKGELVNG
ncbi:MAG: dihydroorotase [Armatimonadetes bacterium]|nr:dihydroorotase [Armatimonadota bacterium]MDW8122881.1 dihydroorotase [Armatimonadota bacterium]